MAKKRKSHKKNQPKRSEEFSNRPLSALRNLKTTQEKPDQKKKVGKPNKQQKPDTQTPSNDSNEFQSAMAGVKPINGYDPSLPPEPKLPVPEPIEDREQAEVMAALRDLVDGDTPFSIFETDEAIEGLAEGVDSRLLRKLKAGEFSIQDHLDLHGLSREQARPVVTSFILDAMAHVKRCLLIIHGRGHGSKDKIPVLKLALTTWLVRSAVRKNILAFCTARPCDGGAGAIYVLLRKNKNRI